ncbi:MAG TPA: FAD-binding and (Fe-S)-binding domain-containing protein [Terriglobales bacterium]|nr:FAD-binding and (Fe-S)-binding domain-containing protein [Terriglobales bacterium]
MVPKLVVMVESEAELITTIHACTTWKVPFTFRAAGTSLSGQSVSDSVLIQVSRLWNPIFVAEDGATARFGPAVLGGDANRVLSKFGRKIGPDPASIDAAMIGGIAANNSSGMCCGNVQDTYHTMRAIRAILADGSILDTHSEKSRRHSAANNALLLEHLTKIAARAKSDPELQRRIRKKFAIKNTCGYSLNSLIDFDDPLDIAAHLLIGSEGTLGFISEITYNTVPDLKHSSTALVLFPDVITACRAAYQLTKTYVSAVELMDRQSLRAVEAKLEIPESFRKLDEHIAALLIEVRADSLETVERSRQEVASVLKECNACSPCEFTSDELRSKQLWLLRKGLFPALGHARSPGTTILIEDVGFPCNRLGDAALDLRSLFTRYGYHDAVIFGHALQGNLHFVFCVDFNLNDEIEKYGAFIAELAALVTRKYDGSLKSEHGTGRNMAPFVEMEWGKQAYELMRDIKRAFDPLGLMNPEVIISSDEKIHVRNLKKTPASNAIIEKCTECGFCERTCPSRHLSLTPRQRISVWREMSMPRANAADWQRGFQYEGEATCATDGLCATLCPLGIDTGAFIKQLRSSSRHATSQALAQFVSSHLGTVLTAFRSLLRAAWLIHRVIGNKGMRRLAKMARKLVGKSIPEWTEWIPLPAPKLPTSLSASSLKQVVYFPSCVSRLFGGFGGSVKSTSQITEIYKLFQRLGINPLVPLEINHLCCGMAFSSKGFASVGSQKLEELVAHLDLASEHGKYPVVVDTSPCAQRLIEHARGELQVLDLSEFLLQELVPRGPITKLESTVAVHVPCSVTKAGKEKSLLQLARLCAERVIVPDATTCCGFAGDRGFTHPELSASALIELKPQVRAVCSEGYSSSRTCEIGLSTQSGIRYQSIAFLVASALNETQPH